MQRPQQISVLDKFWQVFRNNQILWKYDKSSSVTPTTTTTTKSFLRSLTHYMLAIKKSHHFQSCSFEKYQKCGWSRSFFCTARCSDLLQQITSSTLLMSLFLTSKRLFANSKSTTNYFTISHCACGNVQLSRFNDKRGKDVFMTCLLFWNKRLKKGTGWKFNSIFTFNQLC